MANESQLKLGPMEVEPVSQGRVTAHPPKGEEVSRLTDLLAVACEETGLQEKDAAISQGYDPRYWPRVKSGEKQAHLDRISRLPERTQRAFVSRYAQRLGMIVTTEDRRRAAMLDLIEAAARAVKEIA